MENQTQETSIQSKLLKNSFWLYAFAIANAPMQYIIRLITSNDLTPDQIWIISTIMWVMTLFAAYVDLGLRESLNYYIPKFLHTNSRNKITTLVALSFIIQTFFAIAIALILWFKSDYIADIYWHMEIWYIIKIFAINLVISNVFAWLDALFLVVHDVIYNKWLEFFRYIINIALVSFIYMSQFSDKLLSYSIYPLLWSIIGIIISIYVITKKYKNVFFAWKFDLSEIEYWKIQKYSLWVLLALNLWIILWQLDIQFALKFVSAAWAWYYANWMTIITWLLTIITVVCWIVYPMISELDAKQDHNKTNILTGLLLKYISFISWLLGIFLYFFGTSACVMLFWERYIISWEMLKYISLFLPFWVMLNVVYSILAGKWNTHDRVFSMIWWLLVMVVSSFLTTNVFWMWINGIALSLWITRFSLFLIWYRWLKKLWIEHWRDWWFIITNIIFAFTYCIIVNYSYKIDTISRVNIFWQLTIIFLWYLIFLWAINFNTIKDLLKEYNLIKK